MDDNNAIVLDNVCKTFKLKSSKKSKGIHSIKKKETYKKILDSISLTVKKGEVLGILGRNGCGKSTLLKIIAHIMFPDSGTVTLNGTLASVLELGMGFHDDLSGRDNIYLKCQLYGFSKEYIDSKIDDIIDYSGLQNDIDYPVRTYSSGMISRLAFSVIINVNADILLIDEVLSVGDAAFSAKAFDHFRKISKSGKTVLIVSHSTYSISQICSRAIWIEKGKIIKDGDAKDICAIYENGLSESPEIIKDLAEDGDPEAQYKFAHMYRGGINVDQDIAQYNHWIKKSAEQGYTYAQIEYAELLLSDNDDEKRKEAVCFLQNASNKGNPDARLKLATLIGDNYSSNYSRLIEYYHMAADDLGGIWKRMYAEMLLKTARNENERKDAFKAYVDSLESGDTHSANQIASMYRDSLGVSKNIEKMEEYYKISADSGNPYSMMTLAEMYRDGHLLEKDEKKAFEYCRKSAMLGNSSAEYHLATMYRDGIGTESDLEKSNEWFNNFSNSNFTWYYFKIGDYLINNLNNMPEAIHWYSIAAKQGHMASIVNIINLSSSGECADRERFEWAMSLLENLAENGNDDAIFKIASYYHNGSIINKDMEKAIMWYRKGADLGNQWCRQRLGEIYRDGDGVRSDAHEAIHWYSIAAKQGNIASLVNVINLSSSGECADRERIEWAMSLLENIAKSGNPDAIFYVASFYQNGTVVGKDMEKAIMWYRKGADLGDWRCIQQYRTL